MSIASFQLESDKGKREEVDNIDLLTTLANSIDDLEHLNQRNAEILKHINTLI